MRGKVIWLKGESYTPRITPAHAGKRICVLLYMAICQDHPRTCGEKHILQFSLIKEVGSPPHMRGKVTDITSVRVYEKDHPRTCGEKNIFCF